MDGEIPGSSATKNHTSLFFSHLNKSVNTLSGLLLHFLDYNRAESTEDFVTIYETNPQRPCFCEMKVQTSERDFDLVEG